tara:strand:+ start:769 stop:1332 length:564 start_codon:yes stop_codon:yes gene_type:complete
MNEFNLQKFVKKSKDEYYSKLYESRTDPLMDEEAEHEDDKEDVKEDINGDRIEGLLNIELKSNFLAAGHAVLTDFLEDEMMDVGEVVSHLANELEKHYAASTSEEETLEEIEGDEEIEVDNEIEVEAPIEDEISIEAPEDEAEDSKEIFAKLVDAYESAKKLGDDKLTRQLANTITYFNKSVIFGDS